MTYDLQKAIRPLLLEFSEVCATDENYDVEDIRAFEDYLVEAFARIKTQRGLNLIELQRLLYFGSVS